MSNKFFNVHKMLSEHIRKITEARSRLDGIATPKALINMDIITKTITDALKMDTKVIEAIKSLPKPKRENVDFLIGAGWTLPHSLFIRITSDENTENLTQEEVDQIFFSMYMERDKELYFETKDYILSEISSRNKNIMSECFSLFENKKVSITIPTLLSIVEGEMSHVSGLKDSWHFKSKIKNKFGYKDQEIEDVEEVKDISVYTLVFYLNTVLFKNIDFTDESYYHLNRNKVLHGWDNPDSWGDIDFIRLVHTILTIILIKE